MKKSRSHRVRNLFALPRACITLLPVLYLSAACADELPLAQIDHWEQHSFVGESRFDWQMDRNCLVMTSDDTASARIFEKKYELTPGTRLAWRWREISGIRGVDQQSREGDDFSGRVYVAVKHPFLFWQSRVLAYVHATDIPVDTHWPNPYTDKFHMWVVSSGSDNEWHDIERRILDDWESAFGDRPDHFHAIGLMADSDNTGQQTEMCLAHLNVVQP